MDFLFRSARILTSYRPAYDAISEYLDLRQKNDPDALFDFVSSLLAKMQQDIHKNDNDAKTDVMQKLIFVSNLGFDCTWADFPILDVLSIESYSSKRVAYTAASQIWSPNSDVVIMATNRIQKDLISVNPFVVSAALSAIPQFMSPHLAQYLARDVIPLMNSVKTSVKMKAIMVFYQVCLKYPDALRPGFPILKAKLDDGDPSVVFAALTVMNELCALNPNNFVSFIPKLFKMLENSKNEAILSRLITIFRQLCNVESRLPKKLVQPLTIILETTSSVANLFECVRMIVDIPITSASLLSGAAYRLNAFLNHSDPNLRFLCLSLFIKLMKIYPKMVVEHRELISSCLESEDESERMLALDLMANLVNAKSLDGIVAKLFDGFSHSKSSAFRDTILQRVIEICSRNDYDMVNDFDWYITVLMDFIEEGGFRLDDMMANQFIDLAVRVPATRARLVTEMGKLFDDTKYKGNEPLMIAASHIIGEYATSSEPFEKVLQPVVNNCAERVQLSCIQTAFRLYMRCDTDEQFENIEKCLELKLPLFQQSTFPEIQERATSILELVSICKRLRGTEYFEDMQRQLIAEEVNVFEDELEPPAEHSEPLYILETLPSDLDYFKDKSKSRRRHHRHKHSHERTPVETVPPDQEPEVDAPAAPNEVQTPTLEEQKSNPVLTRFLRRRHRKEQKEAKHEMKDLPVTGPQPNSRAQELGRNLSLSVTAIDFIPKSMSLLEVLLQIDNASGSDIPSIDFILTETKSVKSNAILPMVNGIEARSSYIHSLVIEISDPFVPQIAKLLIVPNGGDVDSLEARLRIFPSFFLTPGDVDALEFAEKKATESENLTLPTAKPPRTVLQDVANITRGMVVTNSTDDLQASTLCSKLSSGCYLVCKLSHVSDGFVNVELKCSEARILAPLLKEIELKLKP